MWPDLFFGELEIDTYQTSLWWARDARSVLPFFLGSGTYRAIVCNTTTTSTGSQYHIAFWFSDDVVYEDTSIGSVMKAKDSQGKDAFLFLIALPESYYEDIYRVIQNERPVYFAYHSDKIFPPLEITATLISPPAGGKEAEAPTTGEEDPSYCKIYGVRVSTKLEPVGEGIDLDAIKENKAYSALFEKIGLSF
jgi:hypothetical protein